VLARCVSARQISGLSDYRPLSFRGSDPHAVRVPNAIPADRPPIRGVVSASSGTCFGLLQLFKCATRQNPTDSLLRGVNGLILRVGPEEQEPGRPVLPLSRSAGRLVREPRVSARQARRAARQGDSRTGTAAYQRSSVAPQSEMRTPGRILSRPSQRDAWGGHVTTRPILIVRRGVPGFGTDRGISGIQLIPT